jgi:hypothetical protein
MWAKPLTPPPLNANEIFIYYIVSSEDEVVKEW